MNLFRRAFSFVGPGNNPLQHFYHQKKIQEESLYLLDTSKKVGLADVEETKYMFMSRRQTTGQNHDINFDNQFLKIVANSNIWK
jgi:hypothetical protein